MEVMLRAPAYGFNVTDTEEKAEPEDPHAEVKVTPDSTPCSVEIYAFGPMPKPPSAAQKS